MALGRPKKVPVADPVPEPVERLTVAPELMHPLLIRQQELLSLRGRMTSEGIDSISKLDALLSQINEEVRKLS